MSLGLSAFVYVPFGESVMRYVQTTLFSGSAKTGSLTATIANILNGSAVNSQASVSSSKAETLANVGASIVWNNNARQKLSPTRLRDQMFAYTVTNQIVNSFTEVGLPYLMRFASAYRNRHEKNNSKPGSPSGEPKKRVVFEDEKERGGMEERVFLDSVREEVALPEYDLFADYSEMVIQFGYVVLWSTIWPLAGGEL
jgi:anoctamin-10